MLYRNHIVLGILCLVFFAFSCKKSTVANQTTVNSLSESAQQALRAGTLIGVKQSYALLNADEKQSLWDTKWNAILLNDANVLTDEQKSIIVSIKSFVDNKTIGALMKDPTDGERFIKGNLPYFEKHFTMDQLYMIIECPYFCDNFSVFKSMDYLIKIDQTLNPDSGEINYVAASNCSCYYSIYCSMGGGGGGTCVAGGCVRKANCGLTGTSNCTGNCK